MPTWSNFYFQDANSPIIEQILFFHDHSIIIIIFITFFVLYIIINIIINKFINLTLIDHQSIETFWTILPCILLIFIAIPSLRLLYLLEENFNPSIIIKIIGHQWYWRYEYPNFNISFDSFILPLENKNQFRLLDVDNRLLVPFNTNIQFLISSADVIHAWTIPALGIKIDAVPGRLNQLNCFINRPGLFFGQCSEICGANHSFIPISLQASNIHTFIKFIKSFSLRNWKVLAS